MERNVNDILGFGLMRLPQKNGATDVELVKKLVDMFMEAGFTYFDTARSYLGGTSEETIKTALVDRYPRSSFRLATKMPAFKAQNAEEAKQMFWTSLEKTGAGYFDNYLLHNMGDDRTAMFEKYGMWDFIAQQKAAGLIRNIGFSMHDTAENLDKVLAAHPEVDFVQLQINYADWDSPSVQSRLCYETAVKHGKKVIIMEPVKGGSLSNLPGKAAEILKNANPDASQSSWALRFAASLPNVVQVLSGMNSIAQMQDNISTFKNFKPLTDAEQQTIVDVRQALAEVPSIPCTGCCYCTPGCPQGIQINKFFYLQNLITIYGNTMEAFRSFPFWAGRKNPPSACIECGQCESVCPQHISIIEELKKVSKTFEN